MVQNSRAGGRAAPGCAGSRLLQQCWTQPCWMQAAPRGTDRADEEPQPGCYEGCWLWAKAQPEPQISFESGGAAAPRSAGKGSENGSGTGSTAKAASLLTQAESRRVAGTASALQNPLRSLAFLLCISDSTLSRNACRGIPLGWQESSGRLTGPRATFLQQQFPTSPIHVVFSEAPCRAGVTAATLCNWDSDILWEQASACNYFPTDKTSPRDLLPLLQALHFTLQSLGIFH